MPLPAINMSQAATALERASRELDTFREHIANDDKPSTLRLGSAITSIIEAVGIIGENLTQLQERAMVAACALYGSIPVDQCPECGLPIGSNASATGLNGECRNGCRTCTLAFEQHLAQQGNKCADCGCLIGTNSENCRRCLNEAYMQKARTEHHG